MPFLSSSLDTLLMVTVVYPLAGAALPLCAVGKTMEDWFMNRGERDVNDKVEQHDVRQIFTTSSTSLTSVPEEDESFFEEGDTLLTIHDGDLGGDQQGDAGHEREGQRVELRLFDEQGEEGEVRMGFEGEEGREGWGDSFTSEFSKNYSTATSPATTLPSHFRPHPSHPSVQSLFQNFPTPRADSPVPPDEEDEEDEIKSGSATPSATHRHTRDLSDLSNASSSNGASPFPPSASSSPSSSLAGMLAFGSVGRSSAYTPFRSLSFHRRPTVSPTRPSVATVFADDDGDDGDGDADRSGDSIDRSEVSTEGEEGGEHPQVATVPLNIMPSELDHPSTPYPFNAGSTPSPSSFANPLSSAGGTAQFTFRSPLDGHHPGDWRSQEEEEVGLITPRASPAMRLHPTWRDEGEEEEIEKDVRFDPRVGVIGGGAVEKKTAEATDQTLPSPPDSHQSSPHIELHPTGSAYLPDADDGNASLHPLGRVHQSGHPSRAGSTTSTTAVADEMEERFDDFRVGEGGKREAGVGVGLNASTAAATSGAGGKKKKGGAGRKPAEPSVGGLVESRSLRDGLRSDRPISTISTSSTHAHLGSPQYPFFLPKSHSQPVLGASDDAPGSAVSTLRLSTEEVEVLRKSAGDDEGEEGHAKEGSGSTAEGTSGGTGSTAPSSPEGKKLTKNQKKSLKYKEKKKTAKAAAEEGGGVAFA